MAQPHDLRRLEELGLNSSAPPGQLLYDGWLLRLLARHQHEFLQPLAFSLIIGGAIGNVIDRFVFGAVVDFLYFHIGRYGWPAFNVADSAITVGVVLMVIAQLREHRHATAQEKLS